MTAEESRTLTVKVESHLFYTDVPEVSLLEKKAGKGKQNFIACAIPDENGLVDFYFVVFVARQHLIKYFNDQCDLRYLFAFATGRKYYRTKSLSPKKIILEDFAEEVTEKLFPDMHFFASNHSVPYGIEADISTEQRLLIDGNWDMDEFGVFYTKFSDIYSYEQAINYIRQGDELRSQRVKKAFAAKPFKGGSSYMGFFNDLREIIPARERPSLRGIEYHSPGYVDLKGREEVLDAIKRYVVAFLESFDVIQKAHDDLRGFMTGAKLLSIRGGIVDAPREVLENLRALTDNLFQVLPISGAEHLAELSKGNLIVRAKIALALYRRLRSTSLFFAQGRLSYS